MPTVRKSSRPCATEPERAIRYSTTVRYNMLYRAFHQSGAGQERIVRVADASHGHRKRYSFVSQVAPVRLGAGLRRRVALGVGFFPSSKPPFSTPGAVFRSKWPGAHFRITFFPNRGTDEIALLEQHLNDMSQKIRDNLAQVIAEKEKADSILRCMIEGVLVLDPKGQVLVMNEQAKSMFHVPDGKEIHGVSILEISRHPEVHKILEEVLTFDFSEQPYSKEVELDEERWFRVNAVRLRNNRRQFSRLDPGFPRYHRHQTIRIHALGFRRQRFARTAHTAHRHSRLRRNVAAYAALRP